MSRVDICHAKSGRLVRQMRRPSHAAALVLMLAMPCLLLLGSGRACDLGFIGRRTAVMGCYPDRGERSQIFRQVRERHKWSRNFDSQGAPYPMVLTSMIKNTTSMAELKALLEKELDTPDFNDFHMSATFTRLAFFDKRRQLSASDAKSPLWTRLATRLCVMIQKDMITPRAAANVFWAVAKVYQRIGTSMATAFAPLVQCMQDKAVDMNAFDLANCIWAAATLQESEPEVLKAVPSLARCIPQKVDSMNCRDLSNCLWAADKLQELEPEVLKAVPSLARCISQKVDGMNCQDLSNCLLAAAKLHESEPEVLKAVPSLTKCVPQRLQRMNQKDVLQCLWAAATLQEIAPDVLNFLPAMVSQIPRTAAAMDVRELQIAVGAAGELGQYDLKAALKQEIRQRRQATTQVVDGKFDPVCFDPIFRLTDAHGLQDGRRCTPQPPCIAPIQDSALREHGCFECRGTVGCGRCSCDFFFWKTAGLGMLVEIS